MAYRIKDKVGFLVEASKILSSSLDYNVTLLSVARLVVTNIADFCMIDLIGENGILHRVASHVADPKKREIAKQMFDYPPDPRNKEAIYTTASSGKPILIAQVTDEWLKKASKIPEERNVLKKLGVISFIFVPLKSRGRVIGVLTIVSSHKNFSYSRDDLTLAEELASRAGIAVDNARLYTDAQEAVSTRDEFLSIASHELRTPLTSILLQVQAVLKNIRKDSDEKSGSQRIIEMLEHTEQQSKRLARLINDLLNVSVIATGRLNLEKERVDLSDLVKEVLKRFSMQPKPLRIPVILKGAESTIVGFWDKVRLEQVISNLLSNANKYGRGKSVTIKIKKDKNDAVLIIQDKGIGIKEEYQKIIFERFKRGVSGRDYRGLGVGLYISRQIIEAHGGTITLESKVGKGSTFTIRLPLK